MADDKAPYNAVGAVDDSVGPARFPARSHRPVKAIHSFPAQKDGSKPAAMSGNGISSGTGPQQGVAGASAGDNFKRGTYPGPKAKKKNPNIRLVGNKPPGVGRAGNTAGVKKAPVRGTSPTQKTGYPGLAPSPSRGSPASRRRTSPSGVNRSPSGRSPIARAPMGSSSPKTMRRYHSSSSDGAGPDDRTVEVTVREYTFQSSRQRVNQLFHQDWDLGPAGDGLTVVGRSPTPTGHRGTSPATIPAATQTHGTAQVVRRLEYVGSQGTSPSPSFLTMQQVTRPTPSPKQPIGFVSFSSQTGPSDAEDSGGGGGGTDQETARSVSPANSVTSQSSIDTPRLDELDEINANLAEQLKQMGVHIPDLDPIKARKAAPRGDQGTGGARVRRSGRNTTPTGTGTTSRYQASPDLMAEMKRVGHSKLAVYGLAANLLPNESSNSHQSGRSSENRSSVRPPNPPPRAGSRQTRSDSSPLRVGDEREEEILLSSSPAAKGFTDRVPALELNRVRSVVSPRDGDTRLEEHSAPDRSRAPQALSASRNTAFNQLSARSDFTATSSQADVETDTSSIH